MALSASVNAIRLRRHWPVSSLIKRCLMQKTNRHAYRPIGLSDAAIAMLRLLYHLVANRALPIVGPRIWKWTTYLPDDVTSAVYISPAHSMHSHQREFGSGGYTEGLGGLDWIGQGLTSPPTQYRLSGRGQKTQLTASKYWRKSWPATTRCRTVWSQWRHYRLSGAIWRYFCFSVVSDSTAVDLAVVLYY